MGRGLPGEYDGGSEIHFDDEWEEIVDAEMAVRLYRRHMEYNLNPASDYPEDMAHAERLAAEIDELRGKDLACWCPLVDDDGRPVPCHADVLLEMANS